MTQAPQRCSPPQGKRSIPPANLDHTDPDSLRYYPESAPLEVGGRFLWIQSVTCAARRSALDTTLKALAVHAPVFQDTRGNSRSHEYVIAILKNSTKHWRHPGAPLGSPLPVFAMLSADGGIVFKTKPAIRGISSQNPSGNRRAPKPNVFNFARRRL